MDSKHLTNQAVVQLYDTNCYLHKGLNNMHVQYSLAVVLEADNKTQLLPKRSPKPV